MDKYCDNQKCKFRYEGICIHSGYCIIGLNKCKDYIVQHVSPDDMYKDLIESETDE